MFLLLFKVFSSPLMHCAVEKTMASHVFNLLLNKLTNPKKKKIGSCYWSMYYRVRLYYMGCLDHKETPCPFRGALYQFLVRTGL